MPVQSVTPLKLKTPYRNSLITDIVEDGVKRTCFYIELFTIDLTKLTENTIYDTFFDLKIDFKTKAAEIRDITQTIGSSRLYFGTRGFNTTSEYTYRYEEVWFKDKTFLVSLPIELINGQVLLASSVYGSYVGFEIPFNSDLYLSIPTSIDIDDNLNIPMNLKLELTLRLSDSIADQAIVSLMFYYYAGMTNEFSFKIENFNTTLPDLSYEKKNTLKINHYPGSNNNPR